MTYTEIKNQIDTEIKTQTNEKFSAENLDEYELNLLIDTVFNFNETVNEVVTNLLQSE